MMAPLLAVLGAIVAVAAAVRSTWSPCGLSMLSSITPFGERSRGHRYGVTAAWFVVGSTLGGACLGGVAAVVAVVAAALHLSSHPAWVAGGVALVAAGAVAVDVGLFGDLIPIWRRQVNDAWLSRYRSWVYGAGFGWQLGVGVATYIMTAAVFAVPLLAGATADPLTALGICALYGLVRGVAVLLTARAETPAELRALHRRFADWGPTVRWGVIAVEMTVLVAVLAAQWPLAGAIVAVAGAAGAGGLVLVGLNQSGPAASRRRGLRTDRP
jgi:hypothetical protein